MTQRSWIVDGVSGFHYPTSVSVDGSRESIGDYDYSTTMRQIDRRMRELQVAAQTLQLHHSGLSQRQLGISPMAFRHAEADNISNPVFVDRDGAKKIKYTFDMRQFKSEEISIKTKDGKLEVNATHDDATENGRVAREYHRVVVLPDGMDQQSLKSQITPDGLLQIEGKLPEAADDIKSIPITHE